MPATIREGSSGSVLQRILALRFLRPCSELTFSGPVGPAFSRGPFPDVPSQWLQVIKGGADDESDQHRRVYGVAGNRDNGVSVDPNTCEAEG